MSFSSIVSSAASASFRMGRASARSASHSSLIAFAASALDCALASSPLTIKAFGSTTSAFSRAMTFMRFSTSATVRTSCGCSACSSACMPATCSLLLCSFCRPTL